MLQQQVFIFIGFLVTFSYLLLNDSGKTIGFPFNDYRLPVVNYVFYISSLIMYFIFALTKYMENPSTVWKVHCILFGVFIIDFVCSYCSPYFYYSFQLKEFTKNQPAGWYIPFSWYMVMGLTMIGLIIKTWIWG